MSGYLYVATVIFPLLFSTLVSVVAIEYPKHLLITPYSVVAICIFSLISFLVFCKKNSALSLSDFRIDDKLTFYVKLFYAGIFLFCILDLCVHGLVLFSDIPNHYMKFNTVERHIRHVSMLIWTLAPLAFLIRRIYLRYICIFISVGFLILFLERGRILLCFASMAIMLILFKDITKYLFIRILLFILITIMGISLFSYLGKNRAGSNDDSLKYSIKMANTVENPDPGCELPKVIPISDYYRDVGIRLKWILTYVAVPIFNLSTTNYCGVQDSNMMAIQILPKWLTRNINPSKIYLVSPSLNVSTEFLPFVLMFGLAGIILAFLIASISLLFFVHRLCKNKSVFDLLIVLKFSSTLVFLNFAPQFFTWTNFGFVLLILVLKWFYESKYGELIFNKYFIRKN